MPRVKGWSPKNTATLIFLMISLVLQIVATVMWWRVLHGQDHAPYIVPITSGAIVSFVFTLCFAKHF